MAIFSFRRTVVSGLAVLLVSGCSSAKPHLGQQSQSTELAGGVNVTASDSRYLTADGKLGGSESAEITGQATVVAIEPRARLLTLSFPDGTTKRVTAGEQVRNFNQIRVGDQVTISYFVSVAFEAREPTAEEREMAESAVGVMARAKKGEKPAGIVAAEQIRIATILSVDEGNSLVTLQDTLGKYSTVKAKYPENLALLKAGDKVVVTVTEAVAAQVTPLN